MHDVDLGLEMLLTGAHPTLWDYRIRRETFRFLRKRGGDIPSDRLILLTDKILEGPPRDDESIPKRTDAEWDRYRDHQIRLQLHKLVEGGAELPPQAAEAYARIQRDIPWQPPADGSEEFPFFVSSTRWVKDEAGPLEKFSELSVEQFIEWSKTQVEPHWDTSGGWHLFVDRSPNAAVGLLAAAAQRSEWPISPWYVALGRFEQGVVPNKLKREIAELLADMPTGCLSQIALAASRWLEKFRKSLPKQLRQRLWRRLWDASILEDDPTSPLNFDLTLNHSGGLLGSILYDEMAGYIPQVSAGEHPGLPSQLRVDFESVGAGENATAKLARVRLAPMLSFLYRIDRDWTKRSLLSRMDAAGSAFDPYLWEGYLWSPRFSDELLAEFKDAFFLILADLNLIPEVVREHAAQLFVHMAIPPDRGISTVEAKGVLFQFAPDTLADAAWALKDLVSAAGDKSLALWRSTVGPWFASAWPKRPVDRSESHSRNLVWLAIDGGEAFPEILTAINDLVVPEEWEGSLFHLQSKEEANGIISRFPEASLTLADKLVGPQTHALGETLQSALNAIAQSAPHLAQDARFQRLLLKVS